MYLLSQLQFLLQVEIKVNVFNIVNMVIIQVESKEDNTELMFAAELALGDTLHEKRWNNDNWVRTAYITVVTVVTKYYRGY